MSGILIQPSRVFNLWLLVGVRHREHASPGAKLDSAYLGERSLVQESFARLRARARPDKHVSISKQMNASLSLQILRNLIEVDGKNNLSVFSNKT